MQPQDLFGMQSPSTKRPFKDIRSTRPSVAEQKAQLLLQLGKLIGKCPASIANGSINATREWVAAAEAARKVAGNSRSSVVQLQYAINNMSRWS